MGDEILGVCAIFTVFCLWTLVVCFGFGAIVMIVLGSICLDGINQGQPIDWCVNRGGTLAMLILGCLLFCVCCCGVSISIKNKQK